MPTLKFFTRTTIKSANTNIRVRFCSGRLFDLTANTLKQINEDYWNNDKGAVRQRAEFKESEKLQKVLENLRSSIFEEYNNTPDKSRINKDWLNDVIDKHYNPDKYLQKNTNLFGFIQHFVKNSNTRINPNTGTPVSYKMRREYEVTFGYLREYANKFGEPDFVDIDLEFYQQFVDFLRKKKLATNTIGKKIQTLKIFLNAATEQGINQYQKYKSRSFVALTEESENIYLTKAELNKFYKHDFSENPKLEKVRDLFIVGAWTGLRYSDLQQITTEKINGNYIELKQKKTGKKVVIPIHFAVKEILAKYDNKLPKPISNQKYNEYLKEAAQKAKINNLFIKTTSTNGLSHEKKFKKHELISSHTARRSFCTNAYKDNIPTLAIMAISGHKTEKAFLKYIKADSKEHADKVLKIWQQNGEFVNAAK